MDDIVRYEDYADLIAELDAHPNLDRKTQDFIIDLLEKKPRFLSPAQVKWLDDLEERYLP